MTAKQGLSWRTQPPDKEGWWWTMKIDGGIEIREAVECRGDIVVFIGHLRIKACNLSEFFKLWAGPIDEPSSAIK